MTVKLAASTSPWKWDDRSMHFHANWHCQYPLNTRPMLDWNYNEIQGQGVYVGDTLTVFNPVAGWHGEGDERIYIDDESFPSHLGTGTDDYYGFAWGSGGAHLFVLAAKPGDFVEFLIAEGINGPHRITLHATKSFDYGLLQFSVNGKVVSEPFDGFSGQPQPSGAIDLGVCEPAEGRLVLRVEVAGHNPASKGHLFGLDCAVLSPVTGQ